MKCVTCHIAVNRALNPGVYANLQEHSCWRASLPRVGPYSEAHKRTKGGCRAQAEWVCPSFRDHAPHTHSPPHAHHYGHSCVPCFILPHRALYAFAIPSPKYSDWCDHTCLLPLPPLQHLTNVGALVSFRARGQAAGAGECFPWAQGGEGGRGQEVKGLHSACTGTEGRAGGEGVSERHLGTEA